MSQPTAPPAEAPAVDARDVVLSLGFRTWEDGFRQGMHFSPDRLIEVLMEHPRARRLLVVDPYRDRLRTYAKRALGRRLDPARSEDPERVRHLRPVRTGGLTDPVPVADLERLYRDWDARVALETQRAGFELPVVITTNPFVAGFAPLHWASDVTYYLWDDWAAQPGYQQWWPAFHESYDRVRTRGLRVCAVTQEILERARPSGPTLLVPNGIDPGEWDAPSPAPDWFAALPGPRLLYAGTLDARIDADLVAATARRFPDGSVVLVGAIADPGHLEPLRALPNVHVRPAVSRVEIAALIAAADACLVPHVRTEQTMAMSPLKLYEYVAAGRPVAAVDLPPMRGIGPRVVLVGEGGEFPSAVAEALRIGPAPEDERRAFLENNSWKRRHDDLIALALA